MINYKIPQNLQDCIDSEKECTKLVKNWLEDGKGDIKEISRIHKKQIDLELSLKDEFEKESEVALKLLKKK